MAQIAHFCFLFSRTNKQQKATQRLTMVSVKCVLVCCLLAWPRLSTHPWCVLCVCSVSVSVSLSTSTSRPLSTSTSLSRPLSLDLSRPRPLSTSTSLDLSLSLSLLTSLTVRFVSCRFSLCSCSAGRASCACKSGLALLHRSALCACASGSQ